MLLCKTDSVPTCANNVSEIEHNFVCVREAFLVFSYLLMF